MNRFRYPEHLKQIHIGRGPNGYENVVTADANEDFYKWEHETSKAKLMRLCAPALWPQGSYNSYCPRPVLVNVHHQSVLRELSDALVASVTDIVDRWWFDVGGDLPSRMPLGEKETYLLQWVELEAVVGNLPRYAGCRGSWRPDFLVEEVKNKDGITIENYRITEINARFSFNGFMHTTYGQMALEETGMSNHGLVSASSPKEIVDGLFTLFRHDQPLHLLKGEEAGMDIHMFIDAFKRRLGFAPRIVKPEDLRLVPDTASKSGHKLCAIYTKPARGTTELDASSVFTTNEGELVEEIFQVGLELHQRELLAMQPEMLREISIRCFNDMRTILLVHDKRMLGIIQQELPKQAYLGIITERQAMILDRSIAETLLPGSSGLQRLMQQSEAHPNLRQEYLLKPIRSGKGSGIVFGDEITNEEWVAALKHQLSPDLELEESCVIQRRINHHQYDVVLKPSGERLQYPLVGTYMVINGTLLGIGLWRSSNDRICAISHGGAWLCSVIRKDEGMV